MIETLKALEEALAEEVRVERELAAAGVRKRDALVAVDMGAVAQATAREQALLAALAPAAERRLQRTAEAARALGLPEAEARVTRIAQASGEPLRTRLLARAEELRAGLRDLARINAVNKALTEQSLQQVRNFFHALGGTGDEVTYSRRGVETRPDAPKVMIDEVV